MFSVSIIGLHLDCSLGNNFIICFFSVKYTYLIIVHYGIVTSTQPIITINYWRSCERRIDTIKFS